jgi:hypothetical protein
LDIRPVWLSEDDKAEGTVDAQAKVVDPVLFLLGYTTYKGFKYNG